MYDVMVSSTVLHILFSVWSSYFRNCLLCAYHFSWKWHSLDVAFVSVLLLSYSICHVSLSFFPVLLLVPFEVFRCVCPVASFLQCSGAILIWFINWKCVVALLMSAANLLYWQRTILKASPPLQRSMQFWLNGLPPYACAFLRRFETLCFPGSMPVSSSR